MSKFRIIKSQADPLAAATGEMQLPISNQMPQMPQDQQNERKLITEPIDTISKLVYDADVEKIIKEEPTLTTDEIAIKVWMQYGGTDTGKINQFKVGKRTDLDAEKSQDEIKKIYDIQNEQGKQYERLPKGKTFDDLNITLEDLTKAVKSMPFSIIQKVKGKNSPQSQGPGGGLFGASSSFFKKYSINNGKFRFI
jgi:hypothetical protein